MASKLIVLGNVNGQLQAAFSKVSSLNAKNGFSLALVTGNLFAEEDEAVVDLLAGKIPIPLPTYFTVGSMPLPKSIIEKIEKDDEICPNLHYLGKRSTTKTSEGIKIVTLGGHLDSSIVGGLSKEQTVPLHTVGDAKSLNGAGSADILLTSTWPASIRKGSQIPLPEGASEPSGQDHVAELCAALKPRYHLSCSDFFYEREPFFHNPTQDAPDVRPITRFISIAAFGQKSQKALYAFSLPPSADPTAPLPAGVTASPLMRGQKRAPLDTEPYHRYSNIDHAYDKRARGGRGQRHPRQPPPTPDQCFFCLSNPTLATHLISSIGDDAYLTIAKGPLTTSTTNANAGLDFPAHALIIPLTHSPTIALIPDMEDQQDQRSKTLAEMTKFKTALQNMVADRSHNELGGVTYEISIAGGVHTHWQFIPMPEGLIRKGLVEAAFRVEADNLKYPAFNVGDLGIGSGEGDFFRVWIWTPPAKGESEGSTKCLNLPFDDRIRFSLQFGRTVLAKLLNLEKRIQWRDCAQSEEEEKRDIAAFKNAFKDFDFTL